MELALDNSERLRRKRYPFEYGGIRFKLVQENSKRWCDHLLTVFPAGDHDAEDRSFSTAAEFASALSWRTGASVALHYAGGRGSPRGVLVEQAEPSIRIPPRIVSSGRRGELELDWLPHIQTPHQRAALALLREARASNNLYLSLLLYWQVLEVDDRDVAGFINKTMRRDRSRIPFSQHD